MKALLGLLLSVTAAVQKLPLCSSAGPSHDGTQKPAFLDSGLLRLKAQQTFCMTNTFVALA